MVGYNKNDTLTANQKFIAGSVSGMTTRFITQPIDVVKLRIQLQKNTNPNKTLWIYTARKILKEEGITAFWHGHNLGQVWAIHFILYKGLFSQYYVGGRLEAPTGNKIHFLKNNIKHLKTSKHGRVCSDRDLSWFKGAAVLTWAKPGGLGVGGPPHGNVQNDICCFIFLNPPPFLISNTIAHLFRFMIQNANRQKLAPNLWL